MRMMLAKRATGSILHDEKRQAIFYLKVQHAHDMRMDEACHRACLVAQLFPALICEVGIQHFDGCLRAKMQVFSQVDFGEAAPPDQTEQVVVAKLLSDAVAHRRTS